MPSDALVVCTAYNRSSLIGQPQSIDEMSDENTSPKEKRWKIVQDYLRKNANVKNADICRMLKVSPATANRLLREWSESGKLERYRDGHTWAYRIRIE